MAAFKELFNPQALNKIAREVKAVHKAFPTEKFLGIISPELDHLELKARVQLTAHALHQCLPANYERAVQILVKALADLPSLEGEEVPARGLSGFLVWPLTHFVQMHGHQNFEASMEALKEMTQRFTAEFALRPFLTEKPERTIKVLKRWARDESHHVRRAASESTRPLLPWGEQLAHFRKDPSLGLEILNLLKNDPSEYVRRSVANHLNDIAKDHPEKVLDVAEQWLSEARPADQKQLERLIRHALRGLFKKGNLRALELYGFDRTPKTEISEFRLGTKSLKVGDVLSFRFDLHSKAKKPQKLMIDYAIHHMKANGKQKAKVFKLAVKSLKPGERLELRTKHSFKKITTRKYHPGAHSLEILVNGKSMGSLPFKLIT